MINNSYHLLSTILDTVLGALQYWLLYFKKYEIGTILLQFFIWENSESLICSKLPT